MVLSSRVVWLWLEGERMKNEGVGGLAASNGFNILAFFKLFHEKRLGQPFLEKCPLRF